MPDGSTIIEPAVEAADFVAILTTIDGGLLTKRFYHDENSELALQDYAGAKYYRLTAEPVNNLSDLYRVLSGLEPSQCLVHGEIIPGVDTECARRVHRLDKYDEIKDADGEVIEKVH